MPKEKDELETCKAILGARYHNVLILVEDVGAWKAEYNSQFAAYGLASAFTRKIDQEETLD